MTVDELHDRITAEFKAVRLELQAAIKAEAANTRNYVDARFKAEATNTLNYVDATFKGETANIGNYVDAAINEAVTTEGQRTRRHFDMVAEQFREYTKLLADGTARNTERLDDHEKRISVLERGPS